MNSKGNYWTRRAVTPISRRRVLGGASVGALGAAGLWLAGCGDDDDDGEIGDPTASAATPAPTSSPSNEPATRPAPQGTLRIAYSTGSSLQSFNPHIAVSGFQVVYRDAIGESLIKGRAEGQTPKRLPAIAASWETSPDALEYRFKLDKTAKFHDGSSITSDDVKFSWDLMLTPEGRHSRKAEIVAATDRVEAPDGETVVFKLKQPFPGIMSLHTDNFAILSRAAFEKGGWDGYEANPIAAGAFKFVSGTRNERVQLTAVEGHYRRTPLMKDLEILAVPEEGTRIARLQAGEADLIDISHASKRTVEGIDGAHIDVTKGVHSHWLTFMDRWLGLNTPIADARVRKAISTAINRKGIIDNILGGEATIAGTIAPRSMKGFADLPPDEYNITEAKRMMEAAGYGNGIEVDFYVQSPPAEYIAVMVADWAKIGVNAKVIPQETGTFFGQTVTGHKTPGMYIQLSGRVNDDPGDWASFILENGNWSFFKDDDMQRAALVVVTGSTDEERFKKFEEVQDIIHENTYAAPLWHANVLTAMSKKVQWSSIPGNGYIVALEDARLA